MRKIFVSTIALVLLISGSVFSKKAESFEQAKTFAVDSGLPILLEFVHDD